jgi:hypothetical protein
MNDINYVNFKILKFKKISSFVQSKRQLILEMEKVNGLEKDVKMIFDMFSYEKKENIFEVCKKISK